jgi:enediyne polyketide synthase
MPERPTAVIATGRFGRTPTLRLEPRELPLLRFVERPVVHYPGVELVVDAELSAELDPYLGDHVLDGDRLLPAVIGLEAMAQVVSAFTGSSAAPAFEAVRFLRPLVVPPDERTTVRVAVLADAPGRGIVTVRSERTGFAADHFSAHWSLGGNAPAPHSELPLRAPATNIDLDPDELYGGLLFQSGRFRRLRGYRRLTALDCVAEIETAEPSGWFGGFLPQELVLGDPGARDAALHAVQACIPHVRVVPVGVRSVRPCRATAPGPWTVHAREVHRSGDEFVYDLAIAAADGSVRERWDGLRLRALAAAAPTGRPWPHALLAPFVERHLPDGVRVALTRGGARDARRERSEGALAEALRRPARLVHRADGKPEEAAGGGVSTAHADGLTLAVAGPAAVACDLELVTRRAWDDVLGGERAALGRMLADTRGEDPHASAARVWAAGECLTKAGVAPGAPLTLQRAGDDGWVILASGEYTVATYVARLTGTEAPLAFAVLSEDRDARV